ncbi:outer membrane protein assembly factor BamA [Pontibaca methylaminivorans]|uniref:outer membrane protein assembly factor BamA n=1 Tax=Pontibaca methylaminivorans TaxID=515897 RepID=UPI002FDAA018
MSLGKFTHGSCGQSSRGARILRGAVSAAAISFAAALVPGSASAQNYSFNRVEVEGNQRIPTSTIANYTEIQAGQPVSAAQLNDAYQRILGSGAFESVEIEPRGSTLFVRVTEHPIINRINFEGNRRIKSEKLAEIIESTERRVFNPGQAERDAATLAEAYSQQGRVAATVRPRIIRRSNNRVDLVFEIAEGGTTEIERVSFVGNRAFSDNRLRRVLGTKQAGLLRMFISSDTLIEERIEFDKQVLRDFYLSRGYADFRVNSANVEFTRERDAFYLVMNITEGQQFRFGQITTVSEIPEADAAEFQAALKVKPGAIYSPTQVENSIARLERLGLRKGVDFLRVEPRITRNDRNRTLDVQFVLTKGPRVFVERIDIEGNTTTLDRVIRQQFRIAEGDPFNPREIRESAERVRALGYFSDAEVDAHEGSTPQQVVIDVDVEEQPTGSLSLGGSYSANDGFGVAFGLSEDNFMGRGQRLSFSASTARDTEEYVLGFTEPYLLGRDLSFGINLGMSKRNSNYATYDWSRAFVNPSLTFPIGEDSKLQLRYSWQQSEMKARSDAVTTGAVTANEIAMGKRNTSALGFTYSYDTRRTGLNPNAGWLLELGADYAGLGGDNEFIRTNAKAVAQTRILNEEVTLRATFEAGALHWRGDNHSRVVDRYLLTSDTFRGFDPGGIGPRDQSNGVNDALGGNLYAVARFDVEFPLGLPEEYGLRGGVFYDVGNLWDLKHADLTGGDIVGENGSWRHVVGVSLLWTTGMGPLRFNFSKAISKEDYDEERSFDLTIQARF